MNKFSVCCLAAALVLAGAPSLAQPAGSQRQAEVAKRGAGVMPFSLEATKHVFTKTPQGGIQQVIARNRSDAGQIRLVRQHLQEIRQQFRKGDFSGPAHIHGQDMPGLAELQAAPRGAVSVAYKQIAGGAQLTYSTRDPKLVAALHRWFDAQLSDHGADAMEGHEHHHHGEMPKP
jgi:hypothetical protein